MSRIRRASIAASFTYAQFGLALAAGIVLVPYILAQVGARTYGLWLASGELLAYAAMADFGLLSTLPWLVAERRGRGDRQGLRRLTAEALGASAVSAVVYAALVALLWAIFPAVLRLTVEDRAAFFGPVALVAALAIVTMPLRVFSGVLIGLQDVRFTGLLGLVQLGLNVGLTVVLLERGAGLYALASAMGMPLLVGTAASAIRLRLIAPDLMRQLARPSVRDVSRALREGFGGWLSTWGWRFIAASDAIVLAALGQPAAVAALACTSKLGQTLMQMSWVPSDTALVPLAELRGEGRPAHLRAAIHATLRLYLALAGAVCCLVLAANPAFVTWWVGPELFAGRTVNALLAMAVLFVTLGHGMAVISAATGERVRVGAATLVTGVVHLAAALTLASRFAIAGLVMASIISHGLVLVPLLMPALSRVAAVRPADVVRDVLVPCAGRLAPFALAAVALAVLTPRPPVWVMIPAGGAVALLSLWASRGALLEFRPLAEFADTLRRWPARFGRMLVRLK